MSLADELRKFKTDEEGHCNCHVGWGWHLPDGSKHVSSSDFAEVRDAAADALEGKVEQGWEPGRWWRVVAPDGSVWCETSIEQEARDLMRPGDSLFHLYVKQEAKWVPA